jgi:hypothetical protein
MWSLIAAAVITIAAIALVTAKIGPGLDSTELRERRELLEERNEARRNAARRLREQQPRIGGSASEAEPVGSATGGIRWVAR